MKIARIATVPWAFVHIKKQISHFVSENIDVTLISSKGDYQEILEKELGAKTHSISIERDINPLKDFISLIKLIFYFRKEKFELVHSSTPKAGLLTALAGRFGGVPIRLHTFTGQRWVTLTGFKRKLLIFIDRLICNLSSYVYADSPSQVDFLVEHKIVKKNKIGCVGNGSYGGIDPEKFSLEHIASYKKEVLEEFKIPDDYFIFGYLGRIEKDKGIDDLLNAFEKLSEHVDKIALILVGPLEGTINEVQRWTLTLSKNKNIFYKDFTNTPEKYFSAMDVFCIPSYREGFGTVVIESAALEIPSIGTNIPGLIDSIKDGETGILIEKDNLKELVAAMKLFLDNKELKKTLGKKARERALQEFDSMYLAKEQLKSYQNFFE